jgi:hypothetical protein
MNNQNSASFAGVGWGIRIKRTLLRACVRVCYSYTGKPSSLIITLISVSKLRVLINYWWCGLS